MCVLENFTRVSENTTRFSICLQRRVVFNKQIAKIRYIETEKNTQNICHIRAFS